LELWEKVEKMLLCTMLYHCDSLGDITKMMSVIEHGEDKDSKQLLQQFKLLG